jgi:hypothetical protein
MSAQEGPLFATSEERRLLLYRFGFLVAAAGAIDEAVRQALARIGWRALEFGGAQLLLHPETPIRTIAGGETSFVFLGHAYSESGVDLDGLFAACPADDLDALCDRLDDVAGRFALVVFSPDRFQVFHDPAGSRSVFFSPGVAAASSHAGLLAAAIGAGLSAEIADYMKHPLYANKRGARYLPGLQTIYSGLLYMPPNLYFKSADRMIHRHWPRRDPTPATVEQFQSYMRESVSSLYRYVKQSYRPLLGFTGGADCRTALAIFRLIDHDIETATWHMKGLDPGEKELVDKLVEHMSLEHIYFEESAKADEVSAIARHNCGSHMKQSTLASAMYDLYGDRTDLVLLRGLGAAVVRVFYADRLWPMRFASADEMARVYLTPAKVGNSTLNPASDRAYTALTAQYFAKLTELCHYDEIDFKKYDINDVFYLEHRLGSWGANCNNETDTALFSMITFNSRRLYEIAWSLPLEERKKKSLFMDVIRSIDPGAAAIGITNPPTTPKNRVKSALSFALRAVGR